MNRTMLDLALKADPKPYAPPEDARPLRALFDLIATEPERSPEPVDDEADEVTCEECYGWPPAGHATWCHRRPGGRIEPEPNPKHEPGPPLTTHHVGDVTR